MMKTALIVGLFLTGMYFAVPVAAKHIVEIAFAYRTLLISDHSADSTGY